MLVDIQVRQVNGNLDHWHSYIYFNKNYTKNMRSHLVMAIFSLAEV